MDLLAQIIELDKALLLGINHFSGRVWLDQAMLLLSAKWVWIPLYAFVFWRLYSQLSTSQLLYAVIAFVALLVITDQGSVQFFKEVFHRYRPCHNPSLKDEIELISGKCGGTYGFVSSHASNVFGFSYLTFSILKTNTKWWGLVFVWAFLVSVSRIYLSVHYPSDVLCGAIYGLTVGFLMSKVVERIVN